MGVFDGSDPNLIIRPIKRKEIEQAEKKEEEDLQTLCGQWALSLLTPTTRPFNNLLSYGWSNDFARKKNIDKIANQIVKEFHEVKVNEPFLVGNNWYEVIEKPTRGGTKKEVVKRTKEAIKLHYGKDFDFDKTQKYKDFVNLNDIVDYNQDKNGFFNLFPRPPYVLDSEMSGMNIDIKDIETCLSLVHHIFGDQWHLGLQYLALLVQKPSQFLPVLCLVSEENQTGKSTFAAMLKFIFGDCVGFYSNSDLKSEFNTCFMSHIAVFEEISNAKSSLDKIKDMATTDKKTINRKNEDQREYDVNVHIIINSNNETGFLNVSDKDIRFWVRKVPPIKEYDPLFGDKLKAQAKAFFYFLATFPHLGEKKSRMWFSPEEIATSELDVLRKHSKSATAKNLIVWALETAETKPGGIFYATTNDITDSKVLGNATPSEIRQALRKELHLTPCDNGKGNPMSYTHMFTGFCKAGRPYRFDMEELKKMDVD